MEMAPVEQGLGPLVGTVARYPQGERAVEERRRLVVAPTHVEREAQVVRDHGLANAVAELPAQLQGLPVLADRALEVAEPVAELAEVLADQGLEGGIAGEQGLRAGESLEGRLVVMQTIALEQPETEQGLGPAPRQAEGHKPALGALVRGDAGAARLSLVGPAQRVAASQLRLGQGSPAVRRGGTPLLCQPETARSPEAGGERQLDPKLAEGVRHPMDLLGRPGRGFRGGEAVDLEELPAARIEQGQGDVPRLLVGHGVEVVANSDGDPQDRRSVADRGGGARGGRGRLLADAAAQAEEQEQTEARDRAQRRFQSPPGSVTRKRSVSRTLSVRPPEPSASSSR